MNFCILPKLPDDYKGHWISVYYKPIVGWRAIQYWWNPDMDRFWEPWDTGICAFATKEEAIVDAKFMAECEDIPYVE